MSCNERIRLSFEDSTFLKGIRYSTVRRGCVNLSDGDLFEVLNTKGNLLAIAETYICKIMRFVDIEDRDLTYEQSSFCNTKMGLRTKLEEWNKGFDERELVTIIYFTIARIHKKIF